MSDKAVSGAVPLQLAADGGNRRYRPGAKMQSTSSQGRMMIGLGRFRQSGSALGGGVMAVSRHNISAFTMRWPGAEPDQLAGISSSDEDASSAHGLPLLSEYLRT